MNKLSYFQRWKVYLGALKGVPESQYKVGFLLLSRGNKDSIKSGILWLNKAADQNHSQACLMLSEFYIKTMNNPDKAIDVLLKAPPSEDGTTEALLGQMLLNQYADIIQIQEIHIAEHKDNETQCEIKKEVDQYVGNMYKNSLTNTDQRHLKYNSYQRDNLLVTALEKLEIAEKKGCLLAYHAKSIYLIESKETSNEQKNAAALKIKYAAEKGFPPSMQVIAGFYENGLFGFRETIEEGLNWRIKAAKTGSTEAQFSLGCLVYKGQGFKRNREQGLSLIKSAAERGHIEAAHFLQKIS